MATEAQILGLGEFAHRGFTLEHDVTESKIRRFFRGVNIFPPLVLPQKAAETGQLVQSQLFNPTGAHLIINQVRGGDAYAC